MKKVLLVCSLLIVTCATYVAFMGYHYLSWRTTAVTLPAPVIYDFQKGTTLMKLSEDLEANGVISSAFYFRLDMRWSADFRSFKAGLYEFSGALLPKDIEKKMSAGQIYEPIVVEYVVPEGFSFPMLRNRWVAHGLGTPREIEALWVNKAFLKELRIPSTSFEGFIYPATYRFTKQINAKEAIQTGVAKFWQKIPPGYEQDVKAKGLSLKDAVTLASLIEVETRIADERSKVSEVIWRRLKKGEPIGIDAALIYGIKDYKGDIKTVHLKDAKNPYNTRIHKGLPPTPIASPSADSLKAVLNPTNEGYYYYVRDIDTVDRHYFSHTLAEHQKYVAKLVARTKKSASPPKTPTNHKPLKQELGP